MEERILHLKDEEETLKLGRILGASLQAGAVITLNGDLGSGKTMLTKGIALALGVDESIVSPTFTIVQEYEGRLPLFHFDAYRIADEEEMYFIGFEEYLTRGGVCVIEWAERIEGILPAERLDLFLTYGAEGGREARLRIRGERYGFARRIGKLFQM
ncbi:MAG: tRNA (adenosine(37)-N6)-threonylcarbamoyltransferase complex ATPase subunit type 1 TsaE [Peptostreptococcaceae bacterium]|nr:tRNA (adenosine(37)-N6)-threonylcarbamoyltransferase complex ATPase subunit type 1 TsaE [Peptostreptococcaceae bacterium]